MLTRTCIQCNKEFTMTESEIRFYKSKNLSLPKRCKECREANKKMRAESGAAPVLQEQEQKQAETTETTGKKPGRLGLVFMAAGALVIIAAVIVLLVVL